MKEFLTELLWLPVLILMIAVPLTIATVIFDWLGCVFIPQGGTVC